MFNKLITVKKKVTSDKKLILNKSILKHLVFWTN